MAVNYGGMPNHPQITINDTRLTSALRKGDFETAERLIRENEEPSYLNEGPFDQIPLALVLSSKAKFRQFPRHLRLARLLVEGGSDPNIRVPQAEWQRASPSPMEYVWALYDRASDLCSDGSDSLSCTRNFIDPLFTIGLHDETELTLIQLKEQLLELLDVFIARGGNPNIRTTKSNSTLYHVVLANPDPDMELVMKLCEAGGDLNQADVHRTTPLMDLVAYADGDLAMDFLSSIWKINQNISSLKDQNCCNQTALWLAMYSGSPRVATELLRQGASTTPRAIVGISELDDVSEIRGIPYDTTAAYECLPETVLDEVEKIVNGGTQFPFDSFSSPGIKTQDAVIVMFGKLSAGLQQLCVRKIINHIFFTQDPRKSLELVAKLQGKMLVSHKEKEKPVTQLDVLTAFNKMTIQKLVTEALNLPPSLLSRFEIEAARLQLGACIYKFMSTSCTQDCDSQSGEGSSSE